MKKYILTLIILTLMLFSPRIAYADTTTIDILYRDYIPACEFDPYCIKNYGLSYLYNDFDSFISDNNNKTIFNDVYIPLVNYYKEHYAEEFPYYYISVAIYSSTENEFNFSGIFITLSFINNGGFNVVSSSYYNDTYNLPSPSGSVSHVPNSPITSYGNSWFFTPTSLFETNIIPPVRSNLDHLFMNDVSSRIFNVYYDSSNLLYTFNYNDKYPIYYPNGYDSSSSSNYTSVDLSKYHYVLLNLKDYSKKEAFSTNLQVKGMIGITPIYNYGTTAKDDVMGNKIEDRCNLSYKDYTDYRLYILKSDLENKAIYAIKGCEDNSSFKFDNSLFDITYVTDDNIDDPIVIIDGKEYHTIPYNQLPSTATKNEEENYVPGESKELSFSEIVDNVTDTLSSVWSSIITFMNLFTKFFNTLPVEIRVISISTFTISCILGIIKILKS